MANGVRFSKELLNRGVMNSRGERLGKIKTIAFNMETGRIAYGILDFSGFPRHHKFFAVPWELLRFSSHDRRFILEVPRQTLESSPGFESVEQVAAGANFAWLGRVYEYYSDNPDWERKRQEQDQSETDEAKRRRSEIEAAQKGGNAQ